MTPGLAEDLPAANAPNSLDAQPGNEAEQRANNAGGNSKLEYRKPRGWGVHAKPDDESNHGTDGTSRHCAGEHESAKGRSPCE